MKNLKPWSVYRIMSEPDVPTSPPQEVPDVPGAPRSSVRNSNRRNRRNGGSTAPFKGLNGKVQTLGTKVERTDQDQFVNFQDNASLYVLQNFPDCAGLLHDAVKKIKDPLNSDEMIVPNKVRFTDTLNFGTAAGTAIDAADQESIDTLFESELKDYGRKRRLLVQGKKKLYGLIWGQCSDALQSEVRGEPDFIKMSESLDCIWLLTTLSLLSAGADKHSDFYISSFQALTNFCTCLQSPDESMAAYYSRFEAAVTTVTLVHGDLLNDKLSAHETGGTPDENLNTARSRFLASAFLENADPTRFTELRTQLKNSMVLGRNDYPHTPTAAYDI